MIKGLDHIAIIVSSEKSIRFYRKLGFTELYRTEREHDTVVLMLLSGTDIILEVFIDPNHPERMSDPEAKGLRHFALKVDSIEKTIEELGIESSKIMNDWLGKRYCFISDPDGLPIELHE
jgi:glyoxylase I family protein